MRSLSDLNGLHNYQDISILCKIMENRFEMMHRISFSPELCHSTNSLAGCIERQKPKVIIVPCTKVETV